MILGVMSDTHGNLGLMQRAADRMVEEFRAEAIIHLGDDYADALQMNCSGKKLYAVPGLFEDAWKDRSIPHRLLEEFGGVRFLISHTPTKDSHDRLGDLNPDRARELHKAQVLLHGHTHHFRAVEAADGLVIVNPGHLKKEADRGVTATFAVIDVECPKLSVEFYDVVGALVDAAAFSLR